MCSLVNCCVLRSVSENAKSRFPLHVDCSTAHSLAYRAVGWKYEAVIFCDVFLALPVLLLLHVYFSLRYDPSIYSRVGLFLFYIIVK